MELEFIKKMARKRLKWMDSDNCHREEIINALFCEIDTSERLYEILEKWIDFTDTHIRNAKDTLNEAPVSEWVELYNLSKEAVKTIAT